VSGDTTAPIAAAIAALTSSQLLAFLGKQRWFAAKGAAPSDARVASSIIAPWGDGAFALTRVAVTVASADQVYQLPLALRAVTPPAAPSSAIITKDQASGGILFDAVYDSDFRLGLASALAAGVTLHGSAGTRWVAESAHPARFIVPENVQTRLAGAEQSNTSVVIGDFAILKLLRTLKVGTHPDVEVTRFLTTRAGFANTPALLATMHFEGEDDVMTSGTVQTYLVGASDAWSYALERGRPYFTAPANREPVNAFLDDATRLGAVTRAMHDALASDDDDPAFAAEPATPEDLDRWAQRTQRSVRDALSLLEGQLGSPAFSKMRVAEAQALVKRRGHFIDWIDEIDDALGDDLGMQIRVHGDYHLGQVLHTPGGDFSIIDFEGEPARPLEERRAKTSPLRDVAGMLRSFAYAAATLAMSVEQTLDMATRELRSARWERDVRMAYLSGYLAKSDGDDAPDILPEDDEHVRSLIALFEAEKAFYELTYELNNRPDWAWIPMRGISKLLTKRP
jgi:maltose alpha-D-glucosyltransferase/alpha-amylase